MTMPIIVWLFLLMFFCPSALLRAEPAAHPGSKTIVVALDGSGDFTSIQEAVDSAKKGDTVFVTETPDGVAMTPYDPGLEEQIEAGRAFMRDFRDTFHELAK